MVEQILEVLCYLHFDVWLLMQKSAQVLVGALVVLELSLAEL